MPIRIDRKTRTMTCYEFTIVATGLSIESDDWEDRFFEAGCDDAVVGIQRGVFVLFFDREALSPTSAIESACEDVRRAGAQVIRIEPDPLVSSSDIAERSGLTRQGVSLYVRGERGVGFPAPVACLTSSKPLWNWKEVGTWLHSKGLLADADVSLAEAVDRANLLIENQLANDKLVGEASAQHDVGVTYIRSRDRQPSGGRKIVPRRIGAPKFRAMPIGEFVVPEKPWILRPTLKALN